jgi:hypothetical protein
MSSPYTTVEPLHSTLFFSQPCVLSRVHCKLRMQVEWVEARVEPACS